MGSMMEIVDKGGQYELSLDGVKVGVCVYRDAGDRRVFLHTEIDSEYAGQGLGSTLVRFALDDVREKDKRIVARCPMVAAYVAKHHDYDDLLDDPAGVDAP
jgi:predicted GNAT family acetyltransferase